MADRPDTEVVTVFGGFPSKPGDVHTDYDKKCGFKNAHDAVSQRQRENDAACGLLNATTINLHFTDGQYGIETPTEKIAEELDNLIESGDYEFIMGPLGLAHPDHIQVAEALWSLTLYKPVYLWEDLPVRVMEPELLTSRLQRFMIADEQGMVDLTRLTQHTTTDHKIAMKMRALAAYKSQIGTGILNPYVMYVPERFWQIRDF